MAHSPGDAHEEPIYGAHYRVVFPMLDADGDLVAGATTPDSEVSIDQGTFADCTNEATEIATNSGMYYLDLTGAEMTGKCIAVIVKSATAGMKTTPLTFYPKRLKSIAAGTAQAGGASTITLAANAILKDGSLDGCYVLITNNSPAGAQYQLRKIIGSIASTQVATVDSAWGTNPSSASTYDILAPETANVAAWGGTAMPTMTTAGQPDANVVAMAANVVTASAIADGAIDAGAIAADAITAAKIADGAIDAATFAAGAINAAAIAADAIGASELAADAVAEIQSGLATAAAQVTAQADLDDIQTRLPAVLVSGRMDASVGAVAANAITAAAIATNAIDADALATDAVTEIQAAVAAGAVASVTGAVGSVTGNVGGNVGGSIGSLGAQAKLDVNAEADTALSDYGALKPTVASRTLDVTATGEAGIDWANIGAPTTVVDLSATKVKTATDVETDTQDIQTRVPAVLVGGRMDASVGAMAAGVVTAAAVATGAIDADALAADAGTEIAAAVDTLLTTNHDAGSWGGGGGGGANTVTITVVDDAAAVIVGAGVTIKNSAQTAVIAAGVTGLLGTVVFNLDDGSYKALVTSTPAYDALAAQTLTVSGTTTATYTLTRTTISAPSDPALCRVYGYLRLPDNSVAASVDITFRLKARGEVLAAGIILRHAEVTVTTNASGYFQADLIRSALLVPENSGDSTDYLVTCGLCKINGAITVPSQSTADLHDLL